MINARHLVLGLLTLICCTGCLEDKKAKEQTEQLQKQNRLLMKQLQETQSQQLQQVEQMKIMQAEVQRLKAAEAAAVASAAKSGTPPAKTGTATVSAPPPSPTGPAPKNLPYSLYTGVVSTTKGDSVELTSVNFGRIDRIPLIVNNSNVEVVMGKVKYLRRLGKFDEIKKVFPVSVFLTSGEEVRAGLTVDSVSGVDPRFGSKVDIPISGVIEISFK